MTLGQLWQTVSGSTPTNHRGSRWRQQVADATLLWNSNFLPLMADLTRRTNAMLQFFDSSGMVVDLRPADLAYSTPSRQWVGQNVWLDVSLHGKVLPEPQHFLNEARLSALALAIFLAGYELSIPAPVPGGTDYARVLVLDDVLIGLDYSNRFPLLRLLGDRFQGWQILLFTHDNVWFEMAKEFTEQGNHWKSVQIRGINDAGGGVAFPRLHENPRDDVTVARDHLTAGDLKASAVYARSAFETKLRSICTKKRIAVPYKSNPKEVKADELWRAIISKNAELLAAGDPALISAILISQVEAVRSVVLNQLSHSVPTTLTSSDLQNAIQAVEDFCRL